MTGVPLNTSGYACVDYQGNSFPPTSTIAKELQPGSADQVVGGLKVGNIRLLASLDYVLNKNMMLGARAGYVLRTDPASPAFAPVHLEARFTYLVGHDAVHKKGLAPMLFLGAGAGEFDAYVPVTVNGMRPNESGVENAFVTAGPVFIAVGGGGRLLLGGRMAITGALKFQAAFGGTAGFLPGIAPELGIQFGL
jgi:hypothetical protein